MRLRLTPTHIRASPTRECWARRVAPRGWGECGPKGAAETPAPFQRRGLGGEAKPAQVFIPNQPLKSQEGEGPGIHVNGAHP